MTRTPADYPHRMAFLKADCPDAPIHIVIVEPGQALAGDTAEDMRNAVAVQAHIAIVARHFADLEEAVAAFAGISATTSPATIQ